MFKSFGVASTLAANRIVSHITGTAQSVQYPPSTTSFPVGVTLDTVKDTMGGIPVAGPGEIAKVYFNDTCAAGELVKADTSGRGVPFVLGALTTTAMTLAGFYVGVLAGPSVAATGTIADVYICPGWARGN